MHAERARVPSYHDHDLSVKIRPYLLALKQFEQVFVLARWVRNLFMDMTSRRQKRSARQGNDRPHLQHRDSAASGSSYETSPPDLYTAPTGYVMPSNPSFFADPFSGPMDLGQFVGDFLPNFSEEYGYSSRSSSAVDMQGYPPPGSVEFQTLHFLTDLGMPNSNP